MSGGDGFRCAQPILRSTSHVIFRVNKKAGEAGLSGFFSGVASAARLLPLQLEDFVLDAELLTLQIVDRLLIGQGTVDLLIDGAFERSMLFSERLDAIVQRHAVSSC